MSLAKSNALLCYLNQAFDMSLLLYQSLDITLTDTGDTFHKRNTPSVTNGGAPYSTKSIGNLYKPLFLLLEFFFLSIASTSTFSSVLRIVDGRHRSGNSSQHFRKTRHIIIQSAFITYLSIELLKCSSKVVY